MELVISSIENPCSSVDNKKLRMHNVEYNERPLIYKRCLHKNPSNDENDAHKDLIIRKKT